MNKKDKNIWQQIESTFRKKDLTPQPKGSITTEQFAQMRGISSSHAKCLLREMYSAGLATRDRWGIKLVYWPKKK